MANISFNSDLMGAEVTAGSGMKAAEAIAAVFKKRIQKIKAAVSAQDAAALKSAIGSAQKAVRNFPTKGLNDKAGAYIKPIKNELNRYITESKALLKAVAAGEPIEKKGGLGILVPLVAAGAGAYFLFK